FEGRLRALLRRRRSFHLFRLVERDTLQDFLEGGLPLPRARRLIFRLVAHRTPCSPGRGRRVIPQRRLPLYERARFRPATCASASRARSECSSRASSGNRALRIASPPTTTRPPVCLAAATDIATCSPTSAFIVLLKAT